MLSEAITDYWTGSRDEEEAGILPERKRQFTQPSLDPIHIFRVTL
jgi:hypothetical protein